MYCTNEIEFKLKIFNKTVLSAYYVFCALYFKTTSDVQNVFRHTSLDSFTLAYFPKAR